MKRLLGVLIALSLLVLSGSADAGWIYRMTVADTVSFAGIFATDEGEILLSAAESGSDSYYDPFMYVHKLSVNGEFQWQHTSSVWSIQFQHMAGNRYLAVGQTGYGMDFPVFFTECWFLDVNPEVVTPLRLPIANFDGMARTSRGACFVWGNGGPCLNPGPLIARVDPSIGLTDSLISMDYQLLEGDGAPGFITADDQLFLSLAQGICGLYGTHCENRWTDTLFPGIYTSLRFIQCVDGNAAIISLNNQIQLKKIDLAGDSIWTRTFERPDWALASNDVVLSFSESHDQKLIAICQGYDSIGYDCHRIVVTQLDSLGNFERTKVYQFESSASPRALIRASSGGFYFLTNGGILLRMNDLGDTVWTRLIIYPGYPISSMAQVDANRLIFGGQYNIAGSSGPFAMEVDSFGELGIEEPISPSAKNIMHISPSPFHQSCRLSAPRDAEVTISDLSGRLVAHGLGNWTWTPESTTPGGVYLVHARLQARESSTKIVLIR